jgi:disulfide bond formation protein DsbB
MTLYKAPYQRVSSLLILLVSTTALVVAYLLQKIGYQPCPLCIIARFGFIGMAGFSILTMLYPTRVMHWVLKIITLAGLSNAIYHERELYYPNPSCGVDQLEIFINTLMPAHWFPGFLKADGLCSAPHAPVLGLQVPTLSLILWIGFALISLGSLCVKKR